VDQAKCKLPRAFPIIALVEKLGASPRKVASLYVGRWDVDRLRYADKVGTGHTKLFARDLRERLDPCIHKQSPLTVPVVKPKATWVEPVLKAEVDFTAETANGPLPGRAVGDWLLPAAQLSPPVPAAAARRLGLVLCRRKGEPQTRPDHSALQETSGAPPPGAQRSQFAPYCGVFARGLTPRDQKVARVQLTIAAALGG
jgi:hypothetical protein